MDAFFGHLLAVRLVVLTEVQHEPQQRALGLVADLLRQIALVLRRLKYTNRVDSVQLNARKLTCRPTALPRPCTLDSAAAAPRRSPRRASSKPSTSQRKPTATAISIPVGRRSRYSCSTHLFELTSDRNFQSPARAMVTTHKHAKSQGQRSVGSNDRVEIDGRTDRQTT